MSRSSAKNRQVAAWVCKYGSLPACIGVVGVMLAGLGNAVLWILTRVWDLLVS